MRRSVLGILQNNIPCRFGNDKKKIELFSLNKLIWHHLKAINILSRKRNKNFLNNFKTEIYILTIYVNLPAQVHTVLAGML